MKTNTRSAVLASILVLVLALCACAPFAPVARLSPEGPLPETFSVYGPGAPPQDKWWESFGDPELNALVEDALTGSFTLSRAWARLRQARAQAVAAGAGRYPELGLSGSAAGGRRRSDNGGGDAGAEWQSSFSLGVVSGYEIDLWGRIASEVEAARLEAVATREDLHAAAVSLAAEVAARWGRVISSRMQKKLLLEQRATNIVFLDLVEFRFRKGMVSALDVYQQKQVVEKVEAQIPIVERNEQLLLHELALLLGKPAAYRPEISRTDLPPVAAIPDTGIPADLLASRPDVRSAGLQLQAADWQVAAARANRLPAINLDARAGFGPGELDVLFDNWLLELAASLTAPVLDGNRRAAEVDRRRAVVEERLSAYRETVYGAIKEVEDALVTERTQHRHIDMLQQEIETSRKALEQAGERYRKGLNTYLPVLTQLLEVQSLEQDLLQQETNLVINRIDLYRSLGGAWPRELTPAGG